ncbi:MAG: aldo/keto reductase [Actinomycetota bacterium]|nr:aldo/keto reductase [Actinomycetota bacterium]
MPFFPLGSAFTGGPKILAGDPAMAQTADKHRATPTQVALAWLLARYDRMLLIPGTTSVAHLEENLLAAQDVELDQDDLATLEAVNRRKARRTSLVGAAAVSGRGSARAQTVGGRRGRSW